MAEPVSRWRVPALLFVAFASVYCVTASTRLFKPTVDNHYVHLADAWLHGRLDQGQDPPSTNDWACIDVTTHGPCPNGRYDLAQREPERYKWYVSFPPLPALVILPAVAIFGTQVWDALFWAIFAGLAPALLFLALRWLREGGRSGRTLRDDVLLTVLFGLGTVYYFTAVQGSVWFAAQVVACALLCLYLLFSFDARRPLLAGLMLGLAFLCRPTTALLAIFFGLEAIRSTHDWRGAAKRIAIFSAPMAALIGVAFWHNYARFGDVLEFGHSFLQIRWRPRIETWGLFHPHYFAKNLAIFVASLPWLLSKAPFVQISRHGLALWFTTPNLLWALWPKRLTRPMVALFLAVIAVVVMNLCYQNSGWIQFGSRFSLDYMPALFVLLALCGRPFGKAFTAAAVFAVLVNTFGAITFDRVPMFYDNDTTQRVIFQPD